MKWNGYTLDVASKGPAVNVTFTDSENSIVGQYEFRGATPFNEAYVTNATLRSLVGEDGNRFHQFKRVTGLFVEGFVVEDAVRLVDEILDPKTKMNSTSEIGKVSKLLKMLHCDGATELAKFLIGERARLGTKDNVFGYQNYYSDGLIDTALLLMEHDDSKSTPVEEIVMNRLIEGAVPKYNWKNYEKLSEFGLQELISSYDDKFRGNIEKIHVIDSGRYVVVETRKDGVRYYYSTKQHQSNNQFDTFDSCLLFQMCEPHFNSVLALYEHGIGKLIHVEDAESPAGNKG